MLYCIDTNLIVDIFRGDKNLLLKLEEVVKEKNHFCITFLNLAELFKGAYLSVKKEENTHLIEEFIKNIEILNLNKEACRIYGEKFAELKKQGKQTQEIDLLIGAIVISHNAFLITRNKKHFENISDLKVIEW